MWRKTSKNSLILRHYYSKLRYSHLCFCFTYLRKTEKLNLISKRESKGFYEPVGVPIKGNKTIEVH
jgi:hypothetical protein